MYQTLYIIQTTNYKYKRIFTITLKYRLLCGCGTCRQNVKGVKKRNKNCNLPLLIAWGLHKTKNQKKRYHSWCHATALHHPSYRCMKGIMLTGVGTPGGIEKNKINTKKKKTKELTQRRPALARRGGADV